MAAGGGLMLSVGDRPRLMLVQGDVDSIAGQRADFMRRAAELFEEASRASLATPAERASWASNARTAVGAAGAARKGHR